MRLLPIRPRPPAGRPPADGGPRPTRVATITPGVFLVAAVAIAASVHALVGRPATAPDRARAVLRGHSGELAALAFSPDGRRLAAAGYDQAAQLWDLNEVGGRPIRLPLGLPAFALAFAPDGRRLAVGDEGGVVRLLDPQAGAGHCLPGIPGGRVVGLAFGGGGALAAVSFDGSLTRWDWRSGARIGEPVDLGGPTYTLAFAPGGRSLAAAHTGADGRLALHDLVGGRPPVGLPGRIGQVHGLAFAPDGRTLASAGSDGVIRLWDVATAADVWALRAEHMALAVAFAPDGRGLALGGADGVVRLCEAATGREYAALRGHESPVTAFAYAPDGRLLASADPDGTLRLWDAPTAP